MTHHPSAGRYFILGFVTICAIILTDQYTKWLVVEAILRPDGPTGGDFINWITTQQKIEFFSNERENFKTIVLTPFLSIVMVWNQGISFGLLSTGSQSVTLALIALSLMISILMILWLALTNRKIVAFPLSLIIGGALANVIDRVRFGAVIDFIDFHNGKYHWPAFNAADSFIVLGAMILMCVTLFGKKDNI
ncbi:MAG: signal peptidase II [Alphaproteobacteria bacterium]|nr:signal peptidase II [Alphaproteobacteria bacterium]MCK5658484.1 signal peptidase II [Alphaproteobacteria bacterium]